MSQRIKALWEDPTYFEKQCLAAKDPILCAIKSDNAKRQWLDPEYRKKQTAAMADPDVRRKSALARANQQNGSTDSSIECTVQEILGSLQINFVKHHVIGYFEFDVFVPGHKLLIECQGDYWHSFDQVQARDAGKFTYIDRYFPDYRILYLWERDFLSSGLISQKLVEAVGFETPNPVTPINFAFNAVEIKEIDPKLVVDGSYHSECVGFFQSYHSAGYGKGAKIVYGAFINGALIGVCKFITLSSPEITSSRQEVMELDRFCIHPQYRKEGFASWFISSASERVLLKFPHIQTLVHLVDTIFEESSVFDAALGWRFVQNVCAEYHYVSAEGFVVHKKTLHDHASRNGQTPSEYISKFEYLEVPGKSKLEYEYVRLT